MTRRAAPQASNGGTYSHQHDIGVLEQRVYSVEQGLKEISTEVANVQTFLSGQIQSLGTKFDERSRIPWQAIGVMLSFLVIVGGLVYWPIREGQSRIETALIHISEAYVTNKELDNRWSSGNARRDDWQRFTEGRLGRSEGDIDKLQASVVPRAEHAEQWMSQRARDTELQRQIDEMKRFQQSLISAPDYLRTIDQRIRELEVHNGRKEPPP